MKPTPMDLMGQALTDYQNAGTCHALKIIREDGFGSDYPVEGIFSTDLTADIDRIAIEQCRGVVLDVGAGAGRHSLMLQQRGFSVGAIELSPLSVEVMKKRGVKKVRCMDVRDLHDGKYDTVLLLAHGVGIAGTLEGWKKFLAKMDSLIAPGGQILAASLDVGRTADPVHVPYLASLRARGKYQGELTLHLEYDGVAGESFEWLHADFTTLSRIAAGAGWKTEMLYDTDEGHYLCRLMKKM